MDGAEKTIFERKTKVAARTRKFEKIDFGIFAMHEKEKKARDDWHLVALIEYEREREASELEICGTRAAQKVQGALLISSRGRDDALAKLDAGEWDPFRS